MEPLLSEPQKNLFSEMISCAPHNAQFVEYGAGGSTYMFAGLLHHKQRLFTIEHTRTWYEKTVAAVEPLPGSERIIINLREPCDGLGMIKKLSDGTEEEIIESNFRPYSTPYEELPFGMQSYIWAKDILIDWPKVGFVFVDGIARGAVMAAMLTKLKPGRLVVLHDYSGRERWYDWAAQLFNRVGLCDGLLVLEVPKR